MHTAQFTRRCFLAAFSPLAAAPAAGNEDGRNIRSGFPIPSEGYSDQPYVVITRDGNWLCTLTTGRGGEGDTGQHIVSTISADQGRTWSTPVDIESSAGPEASWVMPVVTPGGRVYAFYTYNADDLRIDERSNNPEIARRVDTLGRYAFKYSDDHGRSWSRQRYYIPMRQMRIDRENVWGGRVLYFWGVGKPIFNRDREMIFGFSKVGKWGYPGAIVTSQAVFMKSPNIASERDPRRLRWELLPAGEEGLRAPKNPIAEETNLVELSDGSLYCAYRSIDGYLCAAYSRDGGRSWTPPAYATDTPGGRPIKQPRAAGFVRKFSNGKFLLWYHNHGGEAVHRRKWSYYLGRNPGWLAGGIERNGFIHWSQPEILLYDLDPETRISYPDFIEDNGRFFITETIKTTARVHRIEPSLLEAVWSQFDNRTVARRGLVLDTGGAFPATVGAPMVPNLAQGGGFTLEFWVRFDELSPGQVLFDALTEAGRGIALRTTDRFTLALTLNDGHTSAS